MAQFKLPSRPFLYFNRYRAARCGSPLAFNPQGFVWIADNGTGLATLYDGLGVKNGLVVKIPAAAGETQSAPTGIVYSDGTINAYGPLTGHFLGALRDKHGQRIEIDGLWGMQFGNGLMSQDTNALFAAAGPNDEDGGPYSVIRAH